jgi:hypothetical protein
MLSLFSPGASDHVAWGSGNYALIERSGRVASHAGAGLVKKSSRLVKEGSMLAAQGALTGSVRDVAPDGAPHSVWRAGFAVALELSGKEMPGKNHTGNGAGNNAGGPTA